MRVRLKEEAYLALYRAYQILQKGGFFVQLPKHQIDMAPYYYGEEKKEKVQKFSPAWQMDIHIEVPWTQLEIEE